ncbi:MAG: glycosyltransferase, partial [Roseivivax sp.]|nr:glycosyltransferase [Roseivivax sp.]
WDVTSAARVDGFAANSTHVAARVHKYWRRGAAVVPPPVAVERFAPAPREELGGFYLWAGELAPYKRPDLAIAAFRAMGKPLWVIGGPARTARRLAAQAGPETRFLGQVPLSVLRGALARCRALIFPGEEDFGIVPVEAMAAGRPVIAYGRGGIRDTVVPGRTGLFFREQSVAALIDAVERFEAGPLAQAGPEACRARALRFAEPAFRAGIRQALHDIGFDCADLPEGDSPDAEKSSKIREILPHA